MSFHEHLMVLAKDDATPQERNAAAAKLNLAMKEAAAAWLRERYRNEATDDIVSECIQLVLIQAAMGTARFRGTTEGEAVNWLRKLVFNKYNDYWRKGSRQQPADDVDIERIHADGAHQGKDGAKATALLGDVSIYVEVESIEKMLDVLKKRVKDSKSEGLFREYQCHVHYQLGEKMDEQIERWGFRGSFAGVGQTEATVEAARARVYKARSRGRKVGCAAAAHLAREFAEEEVYLLRQFLGCKEDEGLYELKKILGERKNDTEM